MKMERKKTISGEDKCECGHEKGLHNGMIGCWNRIDGIYFCKCKKFKEKRY